ncbi:MAG: hypothetical protein ACLFM7_03810 [Bacteroidales bacterium]
MRLYLSAGYEKFVCILAAEGLMQLKIHTIMMQQFLKLIFVFHELSYDRYHQKKEMTCPGR